MPMIGGKKVLVTGGAGFIGSHLVDALVADNDVTVIDDLSSGRQEYVHDDASFAEVDVRDRSALAAAIDDPDVVFHLAAVADTRRTSAGWDAPHDDLAINTEGTLNLLEALRTADLDPKVVYASSCAVYGNPEYAPMDEDHPYNPISPYGVHKLAGDRYVRAYHTEHGFDTAALRIFNTYGPRQPRYVMYDFLRKLQADPAELEVLGTGEQVRDYAYIDDTVSAFLLLADRAEPGEAYNVSGESVISIRDLAATMIELLGLETELRFTGSSWKGDPVALRADVTKLRELGYAPTIDIEEGLRRFVAAFEAEEGPIGETPLEGEPSVDVPRGPER
ncbi:Nucleoside-diphosphate-sugar epimerase [Halapricum desulfuricans]|uniref:Nucleoside-diphosphate-sugar epimerase n=2 Tax=Halapricum desulfuricans TaxID=2841257 RepID=A0A897N9H3_9EURY|nr:Nucleoside-diphosphate-sugar epimerase [Halapricum desulfuricans]